MDQYEQFIRDISGDSFINVRKKAEIISSAEKFGISDFREVFGWENKSDVRGYYKVPVNEQEIQERIEKFNGMKTPRKRVEGEAQINLSPEPSAATVVKNSAEGAAKSFLYVPEKNDEFVKWGHYNDVYRIIESKSFFPIFIWGDSGNGKTFMVQQACAVAGRELVRVNITEETDEDDLVGGYRLVNGDTIWQDGPVITAMKHGGIVLIDEIDRGTDKLMCIQAILEGGSFSIKKTGEVVHPAHGFNIIATANSQGRGSASGKFNSRILDDAFLERFIETFDQGFPSAAVESRILIAAFRRYDRDFLKSADKKIVDSMITRLVEWANEIRTSYNNGVIENCVSTRRLVFIVRSFLVYSDLNRAVKGCVSRFEEGTGNAMFDLFKIKFPEKITKSSFVADVNATPTVDPNQPDDTNQFNSGE